MQATIPTGNLVTLTKPNPQGEVMIYLRYYLGKYAKKTTDIKVPEKDWDAEAQRVKTLKQERIAFKCTSIIH